jgi:regulatory protein YycH of two-component signal transduction system YycFG
MSKVKLFLNKHGGFIENDFMLNQTQNTVKSKHHGIFPDK